MRQDVAAVFQHSYYVPNSLTLSQKIFKGRRQSCPLPPPGLWVFEKTFPKSVLSRCVGGVSERETESCITKRSIIFSISLFFSIKTAFSPQFVYSLFSQRE